MASSKKKPKATPKPKAKKAKLNPIKKGNRPELNPFGQPMPSYPPATQGRQGDWMDKILKDTYGW